MGIMDLFKISAIKQENEKLKLIINEMGAGEALTVKIKIEELKADLDRLNNKRVKAENIIISLDKKIAEKNEELIVIDDSIMFETFALYQPKFNFLTSAEYKAKLESCRAEQKELIKSGTAAQANENWTVNNSKTEGKKMVSDMKKLILRSFNNECDVCVDSVKFNNIEMNEKRIDKSFEALNKLGRIMSARINESYKKLKFEELHISYEYQQKKQEEKEEQKRVKEELREQQKLEQEIRQAREKIAKEKKHYAQAISDLEKKFNIAEDELDRKLIQEKLDEVRNQYLELENEEKVVDYREQNAKAGYVYIISNIGAFGANVYKIGMTRRLEPLDRIDELSDASVPFSFDVHALIFSENAPTLESKLHEHFRDGRLNKLNNRKEFFRADIEEIEKVVRQYYDKVVDIVKDAPAEQYRESLLMGCG